MAGNTIGLAPVTAVDQAGATAVPGDAALSRIGRLWPFALIAVAAIIARWQYITGDHTAFGSGDANLVLTRALFVSRWELEPPASVGSAAGVFSSPPLIPFLLAGFSKVTAIPLANTPVILGPLVALAGLFAFYGILCRAFDRTVAVISTVLVALLPRFAFDSTEPDKVIYVVSFFAIALFFLYEGQRRPRLLLVAGLFMGLALFSYTTALLFLPVFALSHIALARAGGVPMLSRWVVASCIIVLGFFAAYLALDASFQPAASALSPNQPAAFAPVEQQPLAPAPPSPLAPADNGGLLPEQFDRYWDSLTTLAGDGFRDSAWREELDGIRNQILDPVFYAAIAGLAIAAWYAIARRRLEAVPVLLWMTIVTAGFAMQLPAASHATRYPSYVTPVYVAMAVFALVWAARQVAVRLELQPAYALAMAAPFIAWVAFSYTTAPEQGIRPLYARHASAAQYMRDEGLLGSGDQVLYLAWPSYTYALLQEGAAPEQLQTFGWQPIDYGRYRFDERLRYYLYDDYNEDYYGSGKRMLQQLDFAFTKEELESFCIAPAKGGDGDECVGHVTVYRLTRR